MKINIIGRVIFIDEKVSMHRLVVEPVDDSIYQIRYDLFDPEGNIREFFQGNYRYDGGLEVGKMYALVRFWDGWTITDYQVGMTDGVFGTNNQNHAATFVMTENGLAVFPNVPVPDSEYVTFIPGDAGFWGELIKIDPSFANEELTQKTRAEIATKVNAHDSIAQLEAQVDILSRIIVELATQGKSDLLTHYAERIDSKLSLVDLKGEDKLFSQIEFGKARIRRLQRVRKDAIAAATEKANNLLIPADPSPIDIPVVGEVVNPVTEVVEPVAPVVVVPELPPVKPPAQPQ